MGTDYDVFRLLGERDKISKLRQYYKKQVVINGKLQMPWWMGETESNKVEDSASPVVTLYNDQTIELKDKINVRMFVLFPFDVIQGKYQRAALWMCTRYSVIMPNMRDIFSAGGKVVNLGNYSFRHRMPQVLQRIYAYRKEIVDLLKHPDSQTVADIAYNWDDADLLREPLEAWFDKVNSAFMQHKELNGLDIRDLFLDVIY